MPCYEVNTISVEFGGQSIALLKAIGTRISKDDRMAYWQGTEIDLQKRMVRGEQNQINALKREYSKAAVKQAAKVKGWAVREKKANVYQVVKY